MNNDRILSRAVSVGGVMIGGGAPIRLQSMTNTDTMDTEATVQQCLRIVAAGGELVRITAQGVKEAENLRNIKQRLKELGCNVPLIADIHYSPEAALVAAAVVDKVRINPGNYTDRNKGKYTYTDEEYQYAIETIHQRIKPLVEVCKNHGTAIRIGSNHGSLSDRIISKYGDTAMGMTMAVIEFIDIFEQLNFHNIVVSMKASNAIIMVEATRLLVHKMQERGIVYPLHLGVTEAGEGEEGRVKSAIGIGSLLSQGIGDTVRVSLTEAPECEIPVAKKIIHYATIASLTNSIQRANKAINYYSEQQNREDFLIEMSTQCGKYAITKEIEDITITGKFFTPAQCEEMRLTFLQASKLKITKAEFISCPSCGRTQYDIVKVVTQVKERFSHLKGLTIGIMGCIVNGPGEMAGADYGYVGSGAGKVTLFRGKEIVMKDIPESEALNKLEELIAADGCLNI